MKKRILVLDIGGTNVKVLLTGQKVVTKIPSGQRFSPRALVAEVKKLARTWKFDAITVGFPAPVVRGKILHEPKNLGRGWVNFDFQKAFGKPVKVINDAAMQAIGSYDGGTMLFLGLGTGLGSALVVDGVLAPTELAHLPYLKGVYEDYVGLRAFARDGKKRWRKNVAVVANILKTGLVADYVVIGGGQSKYLKKAPKGCRLGNNMNAFVGGQRIWEESGKGRAAGRAPVRRRRRQDAAPAPEPIAPEPDPAPVETVETSGA